MKGICLRGQPGWGQIGAPLTTVVNTFGGTWFDEDWNAQVNAQPFKDATNFYIDLVKAHGEVGASTAGFTECLSALEQSKVAMWYDATSAAGSLEGSDSPVAGKMAYVQAPVKLTKSSGWLYAWSWAMEKKIAHPDAAWQFISWASSQNYEDLVGEQAGLGQGSRRQAGLAVLRTRTTCSGSGFRTGHVGGPADRRPGRTPASSRGRRSASSSSTSRSSPTLGDQVTKDLSAVDRRQRHGGRCPERGPGRGAPQSGDKYK